jgi:hypothetical protein
LNRRRKLRFAANSETIVKSCPACANWNEDGAAFCPACGASLSPPRVVREQPVVQQTSGKAIVSMLFGFLFFLFPAAITAVILGHMSNSEIRKSGGRLKGARIALTGTLLGYAGIAFFSDRHRDHQGCHDS